jgi:hypothetical protein
MYWPTPVFFLIKPVPCITILMSSHSFQVGCLWFAANRVEFDPTFTRI